MGTRDFASRTISHVVLVMVIAVACVPPASAAFYLDLSAAGEQIDLVLKSDTPISSVKSIDIELKFDQSVLELIGEPTFEEVLMGADFQLADCGQRLLPGNLYQSNCGGFFDPTRATLDSGELLSWVLVVTPGLPKTTILGVSVMLDDDTPILLSKTVTFPVPEPGTIALMLAGLGLLGLRTMFQRVRLG
jgi:hypothetical protein